MTTATPSASKRKPLLIIAALVFILIGVAYAIWWAIFAANYESTDDAYVHGNLVQVTSQIPGTVIGIGADDRSEEHTSELQSLMRISYAVYCLKKKKQYTELQHNKDDRIRCEIM